MSRCKNVWLPGVEELAELLEQRMIAWLVLPLPPCDTDGAVVALTGREVATLEVAGGALVPRCMEGRVAPVVGGEDDDFDAADNCSGDASARMQAATTISAVVRKGAGCPRRPVRRFG